MPCSIGVAGIYSRLVVAVRGLERATADLRVLLLDVVDNTYRLWPQIDLALYVDTCTSRATERPARRAAW